MEPCVSIDDCSQDGILRECYERNNFDDREFFCDCSNFYGWVGQNCSDTSSSIYWQRITFFPFFVWSLFIFATSLKTLVLYARYKIPFKNFKISKTNPIFYVAFFIWIGSVFLILYPLIRIQSFYDPSYFEVQPENFLSEQETVVRKNSEAQDFLLLFASVCQIFAGLQIIISWLNVFVRIAKIFPDTQVFISEKTLQIGMTVIVLSVILLFVILLAAGLGDGIVLFYAIAAVLIVFIYIVAYLRFRSRLNQFSNDTNHFKSSSVALVRRSFQVNVVCFTGILITAILYSIGLSVHLEVLKIGGFNYLLIVAEVGGIFAYTLMTYTSYYAYRINVRLLKLPTKISWLPFMDWYAIRQEETYILRPSSKAVVATGSYTDNT